MWISVLLCVFRGFKKCISLYQSWDGQQRREGASEVAECSGCCDCFSCLYVGSSEHSSRFNQQKPQAGTELTSIECDKAALSPYSTCHQLTLPCTQPTEE